MDPDELANINLIVASYNEVISGTLAAFDFALVDVNSYFDEIKESEAVGGSIIDGIGKSDLDPYGTSIYWYCNIFKPRPAYSPALMATMGIMFAEEVLTKTW